MDYMLAVVGRPVDRASLDDPQAMSFRVLLPALLLASLVAVPAHAQPRPVPSAAGFDPGRLDRIGPLIEEAIAARLTPGAVVVVGRGDTVVFERAFGQRAVAPAPEPMTVDTVFDLASLTKPVATGTSIMRLVEEGRVRLTDPVEQWIPGFGRYGKAAIRVRHLLTHTSGLRPDLDLDDQWQGADTAIALAIDEVPTAPPGQAFVYSDINFELLGEIVRRASGEPLEAYARRHVFAPLGMTDTGFLPPASLRPRIAPTERCEFFQAWPCRSPGAAVLRGVVHDPTARRMGGVAGHAGLFGTARDVTRYVQMLLRGGELGGVRVLSPLTVAKFIAPATPPGMAAVRSLGWDLDTGFSANRGELLPIGSFGHTGFTGTSIWADPATGLFVIFLSNRVHPDGTGDVTPLRARVATVAASALVDPAASGTGAGRASLLDAVRALRMTGADFSGDVPVARPAGRVLTGLEVLARDGFAALRGRRVGLVTNHTGRTADGRSAIDLLHTAPGVTLVSLFSPEHGIRGVLDEDVPAGRDEATGLPIHSLYGATRRPTAAMLEGLDTLVIDLQDAGSRFYTYPATMGYLMEEAATRQIRVVVLDRPNPIAGWQIEGPMAEPASIGFNAYVSMPTRHGMTMGELARLFNDEKRIGADLVVVAAEGLRRDTWYDETGLPWINPSPNLRSLTQATLYPGIGAIEHANISVGRGTDTPFEQIGAPWVDGVRLAEALNARRLPGIRFYPVRFTPASSVYEGQACQGVSMIVTDRTALRPVRVGLEIAAALWTLHPTQFDAQTTARLFGSRESLARVKAGEDPAVVAASWAAGEAGWRRLRAKYLLYR
jgi:uncharacterized protein YbbC (DUF1343 family)/CubicO group peptidase (beta-lactamase class C family)